MTLLDTVLVHPRAQHRACLLHFWASEDGVRLQNVLGGTWDEHIPEAIKHIYVAAAPQESNSQQVKTPHLARGLVWPSVAFLDA